MVVKQICLRGGCLLRTTELSQTSQKMTIFNAISLGGSSFYEVGRAPINYACLNSLTLICFLWILYRPNSDAAGKDSCSYQCVF